MTGLLEIASKAVVEGLKEGTKETLKESVQSVMKTVGNNSLEGLKKQVDVLSVRSNPHKVNLTRNSDGVGFGGNKYLIGEYKSVAKHLAVETKSIEASVMKNVVATVEKTLTNSDITKSLEATLTNSDVKKLTKAISAEISKIILSN